MGKQGPCYHCGVTSTPLWRNGPPDKPVLCNACGSRWRTKGSLVNYTPLHSRVETVIYEDQGFSRAKSTFLSKDKDFKLLKRKQNDDGIVICRVDSVQECQKVIDEDNSNRSSSGSALSDSDTQFGSADASDLTGPAQSVVWESMVPSRKRTCVNRSKPSSVEKLTKDLHIILQQQQSSCFSGTSDMDLLLESQMPTGSVEIGHGTILIRHPTAAAREDESEASSLCSERTGKAYSSNVAPAVQGKGKGKDITLPTSSPKAEKTKIAFGQGVRLDNPSMDISQHDKLHALEKYSSPLHNIDLLEVVNFQEFNRNLTDDERENLLKYLPSVDTARLPDSLKNLFDIPEFKENLSSFQQLLSEGAFSSSISDGNSEDFKAKRTLQGRQISPAESIIAGGTSTRNSFGCKRIRDTENQKIPVRTTIKSPKRFKACMENKEPADGGVLSMDSFAAIDDSAEQDLLLDIPCNTSFPQAELLHPTVSLGSQQASTIS